MDNNNYLILGSNGQLGKEFRKELSKRNLKFSAPEEKDCDITDFNGLGKIIERIAPIVIINCAAYNAVEEAETKSDLAYLINHKAVENVAQICKRNGIFLVHYGTDYVFDGKKGDLYVETDEVNPLNIYGKSKLAGEIAVRNIMDNYLVFRTSWVFGDGTQNFIYKLRGWAVKNNTLKISSDEISVPTYTNDIVACTLAAIEQKLTGLYHLTNSGHASRYEWAQVMIETLHLQNTVIPVPMSTFPSAVQRGLFTAMSNKRLSDALGVEIPDWKSAVVAYLKKGEI
jgi:dTDP-4-dehydrorhamnose reductase